MKIQNKLCIGTVQLGQLYGPQKNKKILSLKELSNFINYLKKNKIKYLDTASIYNFDERIRDTKISLKDFKIITKIQSPKRFKSNYKKKTIFLVKKMLSNLRVKSFYAVLLHDTKDLKKDDYIEFLSLVRILKKMKLIKYYGISIYSQTEFYNFRKYGKPKIVQGPLNIFDQSMLKGNFLKKLKKDSIKFHARSIFLQGLLTINNDKFRSYFKKWKNVFFEWNIFCRKLGFSNLTVATNFVLNNSLVDKIVVGFQNKNELKEFLSIKKVLNTDEINFKLKKNLNNSDLVKPFNWK